ncbi:hypothetical protein [uncultured Prevotella sp.]|nr:hypothetical protein [uncultured Prevotella sp.]MBF1637851.1 hypothetical protein [Prevotella sp.]
MTTWKPKKPRKKKPAKTSIDELSGQKKGLYQIITPPLSLADRYDLIQS